LTPSSVRSWQAVSVLPSSLKTPVQRVVLPLPYPGVALDGEVLPSDIALAVEEVDLVFLARGVVADDLG
jgi:hypothetical protein